MIIIIKKMRSLLVILLALLMAIPGTALASSTTTSRIGDTLVEVSEIAGIRTVVSSDDNAEYTVVYDKNNNTMSFTQKDLQTGYVSSSAEVEAGSTSSFSGIIPYAVLIEQDTDSGFKYLEKTGRPSEWHVERPMTNNEGTGRYYFKVWENTSNDTELSAFAESVDSLADKEAKLANKVSTAKFGAFVSGLLTGYAVATGGALAPAAIAAIIVTAQISGDAVEAANVVANQCNSCMGDIEDLYYATDNMHF